MMILAPDAVEKHADQVIDTCIKDILLACYDPLEGGEDWIDDVDLGVECRAKVRSIPGKYSHCQYIDIHVRF